jgi:regulator of nonsense transcripts 2
LKRHTALIKRIRQSLAADNRDQILKDVDSLSLEKYIDEIAGAVVEGVSRCKTEKDVWAAVEVRPKPIYFHSSLTQVGDKVISSLHRRFPTIFTPALVSAMSSAISAPNRAALSSLAAEQREKEDNVRVTRQRPVLRVCSELALVGIIRDAPGRSGGEWIMKSLKELASCLCVHGSKY